MGARDAGGCLREDPGSLKDQKKGVEKAAVSKASVKKTVKFFGGKVSKGSKKVKGKLKLKVKKKMVEGPAEEKGEEKVEAKPEAEGSLPAGQRVRLTGEDLLQMMRLGDDGVVQSSDDKDALVRFDKSVLAVRVSLRLLTRAPPGGFVKSENLSGLCRLSQEVKVLLLREAGVGDPLEDEVTPWGDELLSDQCIDLFAAVVRQNLKLLENPKLRYVPTRLSRFLLEDATGKPAAADAHDARLEVKERRLSCLKRFSEESELLLVPIFAEKHWTLLRIWKHEGAETEVEYMDSLQHEHKGCLSQAQAMLRLLKLSDKVERRNVARQTGVDCGHWVCWYVEDAMRAFAGEGRASQGWPSEKIRQCKSRTQAWHKALTVSFGKWRDKRQDEKKHEADRKKLQAQGARQYLEKKGLLEKLTEAEVEMAKLLPGGEPVPEDVLAREKEELAVALCRDALSVEDLDLESRAAFEAVRDRGLGVCSSCRWTNGCLRCHERIAWDHYVRQSLRYAGQKLGKKKK